MSDVATDNQIGWKALDEDLRSTPEAIIERHLVEPVRPGVYHSYESGWLLFVPPRSEYIDHQTKESMVAYYILSGDYEKYAITKKEFFSSVIAGGVRRQCFRKVEKPWHLVVQSTW